MNFRNIKVIIAREYLTRVKKKSFLWITFLGPVFFAAVCVLPSLIMFFASEKAKSVAVVDESGIVMPYMTDNETFTFTDYTGTSVDSLKAAFKDMGLDAIVTVSPLDEQRSVSVAAYASKPLSVDAKEAIGNRINDAVENYRLETYHIDGLKQIMSDVKADVSVATFTIDDEGSEKMTSSEVYMIVSLVLSMIIYLFITMFSAMVMNSVIEEKSSRVVEVLVSSVKATELMFGKIIGVACVALTQFFLWVVLTAVIVTGVGTAIGFDKLAGAAASADTEQLAQMADPTGTMDLTALTAPADTAAVEGQGGMAEVMAAMQSLDYTQIIVWFFVFFILGYLLYASLFAAIGSAVDNEADTQQLQLPVTIPLLIGFFIAFYAFKAPDSPVVFWGSMIPLTSPIVMLARIPFGVAPWELAVSLALLLATFVALAWCSAKIYRIGILMFGKKSSFKDLWRWLRMK